MTPRPPVLPRPEPAAFEMTEIERLREALWQCGFWARNPHTGDAEARKLVLREVRRVLARDEFVFEEGDE